MVAKAREKRLFLMEAMWARFNPVFTKIREILAAGTLGDIRMLIADFGFRREFDPTSRLFALELGGGALLDVGIYPVSMASLVFGRQPETIQSSAHLGQTGSDEQAAMIFTYPGGKIASLTCAVATDTNQVALIAGTKGRITIPSPWWKSTEFVLTLGGTDPHAPGAEPPQTIAPPHEGNLYNYQAVEVGRCLREGLLESPVMPLDESISLMETLDAVRKPWGLVYPTER
jgi:predicted dehydrogenase